MTEEFVEEVFSEFTDLIEDSDSSWREKLDFMKIRMEELKAGDPVDYTIAMLDAQLLANWMMDHDEEAETADKLAFAAFIKEHVTPVNIGDMSSDDKKRIIDASIVMAYRTIKFETDNRHIKTIIEGTMSLIQVACEDEEFDLSEEDIDEYMRDVANLRKELMRREDVSNGAQSNMEQYFMRDYEGMKQERFKKW